MDGLANTAPDGFRIPVRRRPHKADAAPHRRALSLQGVGRPLTWRSRSATLMSRQAGGHLALGVEPDVSGARDIRLHAGAVHRRSVARARNRGSRCLAKGAHKVQIDFTEGRLAIKLDPTGNLLNSFIDLNNLALSRSRPRSGSASGCIPAPAATATPPTARGRLRRTVAEPVRAQRRKFLYRAGGRTGSAPRPENHPQAHQAGAADLCRRRLADRPQIETAEEVRDRILEAAEYIPIEQLGTTDDCGFSRSAMTPPPAATPPLQKSALACLGRRWRRTRLGAVDVSGRRRGKAAAFGGPAERPEHPAGAATRRTGTASVERGVGTQDRGIVRSQPAVE